MPKPVNKIVPLSAAAKSKASIAGHSANDDQDAVLANNARHSDAEQQPLIRLQDLSRQLLCQLLQHMFDSADDALFALADKAQNNSEQNVYFESMRDIRLKRRRIEAAFSQSIPSSFDELAGNATPAPAEPVSQAEPLATSTALSLVQNDELEERVALDGIVSKFLGTETDALRALTQRLDSLVSAQTVDESNNPLGPRVVCSNFMQACRCLEVDIKSKLVVYKLFEKQVMKSLDDVHHQCNTLFIEAGVLPGLVLSASGKTVVDRPTSKGRRAENDGQEVSGEAPDVSAQAEELYAAVRQLMTQSHFTGAAFPPASAQWFMPGQAQELPRSQLFELLTEAQTQLLQSNVAVGSPISHPVPASGGIGSQPASSMHGIVDVHQTMRSLLESKNVVEKRSLPQLDFDAINLVSMLFQFILDDDSLAAAMKAQLARLQIPVLKAAMLDKSFFGTEGHPARQLLNKMATAAIGWVAVDAEEDDPLLNKIRTSVDTLLREFHQNTEIFQTQLHDFELFLQQECKRATLLEKRAVDAADGKARTARARAEVQNTLDELLLEQKVPSVVEQLLREAWSNVMFLAFVRNGENSQSWEQSVGTAKQLIWSVNSQGKASLMEAIPGLLRELREGLTQVSFDSFKMNTLFSELEKIHIALLSDTQEESSENQNKEESAASAVIGDQSEDNAAGTDGLDDSVKLDDSGVSAQRASEPGIIESSDLESSVEQHTAEQSAIESSKGAQASEAIDAVGPLFSDSVRFDDDWDEGEDLEAMLGSIDALLASESDPVETQTPSSLADKADLNADLNEQAAVADAQPLEPLDQSEKEAAGAALDTVELPSMVVGSWIEMLDEAELKARAKLAAVTRPGDQHIFVNRAGMKVMVLSPAELQQRIGAKTIKVLDDGALFDRALQSVIGSLRQIKKPEVH